MRDDTLEILRHNRVLRAIDVHLGRFFGELRGGSETEVVLGAAMVSRAAGGGDICLDLQTVAETELLGGETGRPAIACPPLQHWEDKLLGSSVVGRPGDYRPLILDDRHRLYFYRYWRNENDLCDAILRRTRIEGVAERLDLERLRGGLQRIFPSPMGPGTDWQKIAALVAVSKTLSVITGGPGTGKTSTVAAILALILEQHPARKPRIALAAPTGKAAARLGEALRYARETLPVADSIRSQIPTRAVTIHRLLGSISGRFSAELSAAGRLMADVIIIDEASMVDLALMVDIMRALNDETQLVLIGDKDQLASVEAGAVLGDLCGRGRRHGYSEDLCRLVEIATGEAIRPNDDCMTAGGGLADCIVELRHSHRFAPDGGIGALSRHINNGRTAEAISLLQDDTQPSVRWMSVTSAARLHRQLADAIAEPVAAYRQCSDPQQALETFNRMGLLCAVNKGPCGVDAVNRMVERLLSANGQILPVQMDGSAWYAGRPVMITRNDYHLGLFNGDIGIALPDSCASPDLKSRQPDPARLMVWFQDTENSGLRRLPVYRLPDHRTVYAMTVHKSQGSEFDTVHLVLPMQESTVLSRELIYTAITRARRKVVIWGPQHVLVQAIGRRTERSSGLRDALWGQ